MTFTRFCFCICHCCEQFYDHGFVPNELFIILGKLFSLLSLFFIILDHSSFQFESNNIHFAKQNALFIRTECLLSLRNYFPSDKKARNMCYGSVTQTDCVMDWALSADTLQKQAYINVIHDLCNSIIYA